MSDEVKELPGVAKAILQLKREFHKVAKSAKQPIVLVPEEALEKIAHAISERIYSAPIVDFFMFGGVPIVSIESGEVGIKAAQAKLREISGITLAS